jgi:Leucine-rich repeat (LRR) protein
MFKSLSPVLLLLALASNLHAQPGDSIAAPNANPEIPAPAGPLLSAYELERAPYFYSVGDAMRNPAAVYKLSLSGQKLRAIPDEVFRMSNLQILNLSGNRIEEVPAEIRNLKNLQIIILSNNRIRVLPDAFRELENATHLYLGRNRLIEVSAWVGGLSKLRALDVSFNHLTEYEIQRLQQRMPRCLITH